MKKISVVIITLNEELNISRCPESVKNIADEIILVDSYSNDSTVPIAERYGAKIFYKTFQGFGAQKAFAIEQASYDWIFSIDADEVVSSELQESILKEKAEPRYGGYKMNVLPNYCGQWIRHCGWYPQPKLRLFNKCKCRMNSCEVHESIVVDNENGGIGFLVGDLIHYSYRSFSDHARKIELYSELAARAAVGKGKRISLIKIIFAPGWIFFYNFIFRAGFLDGYFGYVICKFISYGSAIKYAKIRLYSQVSKKII
jgi:glycosyltransferase involved in cell wall biosynthesis